MLTEVAGGQVAVGIVISVCSNVLSVVCTPVPMLMNLISAAPAVRGANASAATIAIDAGST